MNYMFDAIRKLLKIGARDKSYTGPSGHRYHGSTMAVYKGQSFDNTYPNISKVANQFMKVKPYAEDANGKPLEKQRLIDALYHPNQQMSSVDFREALAVMTLVHRKVYLLVWRREGGRSLPGGRITADNVAGFTFLEGVSEVAFGDTKIYRVGAKTYSTAEVIEIYGGIDPYNLGRGYSPSVSAAKWANLDDYITAYQSGFFENGAVPAGEFIITAATPEQYNQIVDGLQKNHRGSGHNNNIVYTHRPINPATGSPANAQIEWVPFAQSNKEMSLDAVFKQANDKLDSAYGVPSSIRGVNDNNTYASVRVDQQLFIGDIVDTLCLRIWTRITFEMNRITGGLGFAITYDLDIPGVAEEEKVQAETKSIEFDLIDRAVKSGYALNSVVDAFGLSNGYKLLEEGYVKPEIHNDKPDVDEGDEVGDAPSAEKQTLVGSTQNLAGAGASCTCGHNHKAAEPDDQDVVDELAKVIRSQMERQIEKAVEGNGLNKDVNDADDEQTNEMVEQMLVILMAYMLVRGSVSYQEGITLLTSRGFSADATTQYAVSQATKLSYQNYLTNVARSYTQDTGNAIRSVLAQGQAEGWDKETLAQQLRGVMNTDEWRVQRLARSEEHRTAGQSGIDAMSQLMRETGVKVYKVWHTNSGNPCPYCQEMEGKRALVTEVFLPVGGTVTDKDGGTFVNTFVDVDSADLHPGCHCYVTFELEGEE
jgi:hypothetical protein